MEARGRKPPKTYLGGRVGRENAAWQGSYSPLKGARPMQQDIGKVKLGPVGQIGVVVRDAQKAMDYYSSLFGIGPWETRELGSTEDDLKAGRRPWRVRLCFASMGQVQLELIEILEGRTIHSRFLESKGEGLHHLGFYVTDIEGKLSQLERQGVGVLLKGKGMAGSFAYLDTEATGGVIFELIERAPVAPSPSPSPFPLP